MDFNIKIVGIRRGAYARGTTMVKLSKNKCHKLNKKNVIDQNFTEEMRERLNFFYFKRRYEG